MAIALTSASQNLARNLELLRKKRNLSQGMLARLAEVPRSTLTHLESGQGNPSLSNLCKIAGALQVSIEELLSRPRASCMLIRSVDIKVIKRSQGMASLYKLLPDPLPGMEIDRLEIVPRGRMGGVPHVAGTKEYLTCIQGMIAVQVAGEEYKLERGDVFAFPGDQHHSYSNPGERLAIGISVVALAPAGV